MERYIGLDAHGSSCTFGVVGPSGQQLRHDVVETNGAALVNYVRSIPGRKYLCVEEGTQSAWLYELLAPHVEELVVAGIRESRGPKSDRLDAFQRVEELRIGAVKTSVFKAPRQYARLRELSRVHTMLVRDVVRVQGRLKGMYRARGIATPGSALYNPSTRGQWLKQLPVSSRWAAEQLHEEYAQLRALKQQAEAELVAESRRHRISSVLATAPGLGPIRVAQLLPIVVTPHRFRTRRQFWSYCGLGNVMRSSSDWVQTRSGSWVRAQVRQTRGLNRNHNATAQGDLQGRGDDGRHASGCRSVVCALPTPDRRRDQTEPGQVDGRQAGGRDCLTNVEGMDRSAKIAHGHVHSHWVVTPKLSR